MKKYFGYILLIILSAWFGLTQLNAATCNYLVSSSGSTTGEKVTLDIVKEKVTYNHTVYIIKDAISGKELKGFYRDDNWQTKDRQNEPTKIGNNYYFAGFTTIGDYGKEDWRLPVNEESETKEGCPTLYLKELDYSVRSNDIKSDFDNKNSVKIRVFCNNKIGLCNGSAILPTVNNNGDTIINEENNAAATKYVFSRATGLLIQGSTDAEIQTNIYIYVYDTNDLSKKYYIQLDSDPTTGGYLDINNAKNGIIWEATPKNINRAGTLIVRSSEFDEIKDALVYGGDTEKAKIIVQPVKERDGLFKKTKYAISINGVSDAINEGYDASSDYDITKDKDFNFNIIINNFDKSVQGCTYLLGGENSKMISYLQTAYTIIKIVSIILLIIMSMIDFAQNVLSGKEEPQALALKWAKRLGILVLILLLPAILGLIGEALGFDITCGIK